VSGRERTRKKEKEMGGGGEERKRGGKGGVRLGERENEGER